MPQYSRRRIGAVDLGMTVLAGSTECADLERAALQETGMAEAVALRAQPRTRDPQKELIHRAMRVMAEAAVLAHGRMLEQEWPALFGVALVASVVDRIAAQHRLGVGSVRIMTIRAHHLALADRHVR